jgi:hypothetical protein
MTICSILMNRNTWPKMVLGFYNGRRFGWETLEHAKGSITMRYKESPVGRPYGRRHLSFLYDSLSKNIHWKKILGRWDGTRTSQRGLYGYEQRIVKMLYMTLCCFDQTLIDFMSEQKHRWTSTGNQQDHWKRYAIFHGIMVPLHKSAISGKEFQ